MSIKPDWWIREQALRGMIEPFEENLVREGVISYGLSSFGYDLRAAPEWAIFVNAFHTVVDPKHFDTSSLVETEADNCIIPPNSFVLTRSVEYLRIPEDVMVVALGKSSYARCFRGDTRVALVGGTALTLEEMAERADRGEFFLGYSIGRHGKLIVTSLDAPRYVGRDSLLEIRLDSGEPIHATPDHRFLTRDGRMVVAADLRPGVSLMPLYRTVAPGYEAAYQPLTGYLSPTHRLFDEWSVRSTIYRDEPGTHRYQTDQDGRNDDLWNPMQMGADEHIQIRCADSCGETLGPDGCGAVIRKAFAAALAREAHFRGPQRQRDIAHRLRLRGEIAAEPVGYQTGSTWGAAQLLDYDRSSHFPPEVPRKPAGLGRWQPNHKVISVRSLRGEEDVFCLTVSETGNFALEAGVFVHNCGIVANVTPLEPGWEGHVTLELSNTTPLPAKVYANEGIVQLLFFQGERPEVTYADRKGKYQGQTGVTLPKL
ncbi:MAG: hypothetical protein OXC09_00635 [Truepera sp.]|nr:hypothetical protein [Truepera sp.]